MRIFTTMLLVMFFTLTTSAQSLWGKTNTNNTTNYNFSDRNRTSAYNSNNVSMYSVGTNTSVRYQQAYTRKDGTFVQGHYRTISNSTNHDNFSTSGNYNSFTGSTGYRARDYSSDAYNYGRGQQIYQGSRGGQYYINRNGNRTDVPKRGF